MSFPRTAAITASVIFGRDATGKRYFTDIAFDPSHGVPMSWHREEAMQVRKPGVVDDLARALQKAWPTMKIGVEALYLREIR